MHLLWCIIIQDEFIVLLSIEMGWGGVTPYAIVILNICILSFKNYVFYVLIKNSVYTACNDFIVIDITFS